jgi:hypothetical protein
VFPVHGLELGANDRKVDVFEVLDRLEIHHNGILHKKVESVTTHLLIPVPPMEEQYAISDYLVN